MNHHSGMLFMGLEIGGTNLSAGLLDSGTGALIGTGRKTVKLAIDDAAREPQALVDVLVSLGSEMLGEQGLIWEDIIGVGIACPGQISRETGVVVGASSFPSWSNVPLADMVQDKTYLPTTVLNDASAAASAEFAGRDDEETIAVLTLGTGIGLGVVSNGRLLSGSRGLIEGGHMIVDPGPDARLCNCGQRGCLEAYASATAVAKIFSERRRAKAWRQPSIPPGIRPKSSLSLSAATATAGGGGGPGGLMACPLEDIDPVLTSNQTPTPSKSAPIFPRAAFSREGSSGVKDRIRELERKTSMEKEVAAMARAEAAAVVAGGVAIGSTVHPPPSPSSTPASPSTKGGNMTATPAGGLFALVPLSSDANGGSSNGVIEKKTEEDGYSGVAKGVGSNGIANGNGTKVGHTGLTSEDVFRMAAEGDRVAVGVVREACAYLGLACVNVCRVVDPDVILLAGGMSQAAGLVDKVRQEFTARGWNILPHECHIELANACAPCSSGVVGAAGAAACEHARQARRELRRSRASSRCSMRGESDADASPSREHSVLDSGGNNDNSVDTSRQEQQRGTEAVGVVGIEGAISQSGRRGGYAGGAKERGDKETKGKWGGGVFATGSAVVGVAVLAGVAVVHAQRGGRAGR